MIITKNAAKGVLRAIYECEGHKVNRKLLEHLMRTWGAFVVHIAMFSEDDHYVTLNRQRRAEEAFTLNKSGMEIAKLLDPELTEEIKVEKEADGATGFVQEQEEKI